jgi:tetratricopeptide (TPR) repeat protein
MWRWLLVPLILIPIQISFSAPTSSGPVSDQESEVLWKESQTAIQESRFQDAANLLHRYVDRYPGKLNYLEAHFHLGKALMEMGNYSLAIPHLKSFIELRSAQAEGVPARLLLIQSYLEEKKYHEAYLGTLEIDQLAKKIKLTSDFLLETLLLKTQALLGLKRETRAWSALESAEKQLSEKNSSRVRGKTYGLKLDLKIKTCEELPSKGPLDEGQIRDQLTRRGTCLLEAFLIYQNVLKTGDLRATGTTTTLIQSALKQYAFSCAHPPHPPVIQGQPRTPQELERYLSELSDLLMQECRKKVQVASDLFQSWKPTLPPTGIGFYNQVSQSLENFTSRKP